jgi:hypothetical protein
MLPLSFTSELTGPRWLAATCAADVPPFGLVRVTGQGPTGVYTVAQPDADGQAVWAAGALGLSAGKVGVVTADWPAYAAYDTANTPAVGATWGAAAGSWKLTKDNEGFRVAGSPDTAGEIVAVERRAGPAAPGCHTDVTEDGTVNVTPTGLAGTASLTGLVVGPGACPPLAIDTEVDSTTTETLLVDADITLYAGKVRLVKTKVTSTNHFNALGVHIDRTAGSPVVTNTDLDLCDLEACCAAEELEAACSRSAAETDTETPVDFTVTPSGGVGPYTYLWAFGDDETSTDQNPSHTYAEAGPYSPSVTVTDACGTEVTCGPGAITVTAPGTVPGAECVEATSLADGVPFDAISPTAIDNWFTYSMTGAMTSWKITITDCSDAGLVFKVYYGSCGFLNLAGTITGNGDLTVSPFTGVGIGFVGVEPASAGASYTIVYEENP